MKLALVIHLMYLLCTLSNLYFEKNEINIYMFVGNDKKFVNLKIIKHMSIQIDE